MSPCSGLTICPGKKRLMHRNPGEEENKTPPLHFRIGSVG
jgi:hypothetical protein